MIKTSPIYPYPDFSILKGKYIISLAVDQQEDVVRIMTSDGDEFSIYHQQDCCESVTISSIAGDIEKMLNHEIIEASEDNETVENVESATETTYLLKTKDHQLVISWMGESNGYYGETPIFVHDRLAVNVGDTFKRITKLKHELYATVGNQMNVGDEVSLPPLPIFENVYIIEASDKGIHFGSNGKPVGWIDNLDFWKLENK